MALMEASVVAVGLPFRPLVMSLVMAPPAERTADIFKVWCTNRHRTCTYLSHGSRASELATQG